MKKILGVVLASALVAGAFAQVSTGVEFVTDLDVVQVDFKKDSDATQSYLKLDNTNDTLIGVTASGKNAGITAQVTFDLNEGFVLNGKDIGADINGDGVVDEKDKATISKKPLVAAGNIYGWFGIGGFKLTTGKFGSRLTNRMKQSVGRIVDVSFVEAYKYGIAIKDHVGVDADNMTNGANLAMIGDYTFPIGDAKLLAKAAIFDTTPGFPSLKIGYGFEAALQTKLFTIDAVVKVPYASTAVTGVYVSIVPVKMISIAAGGTLAWDNRRSASKTTNDFAFGIDARVRVAPIDALAVTVMGNYSYNIAKDDSNNVKNTDGLYVTLNGTYILNDMFDLFCEVGYFDASTKAYENANNLKFQVGTTLKPVENVKISGSVQAIVPFVAEATRGSPVFGLKVPVALSIAF